MAALQYRRRDINEEDDGDGDDDDDDDDDEDVDKNDGVIVSRGWWG